MNKFIHKLTLYNRFLMVIVFTLYKLASNGWYLSKYQILVLTLLMGFEIGISIIIIYYRKEVQRKWIVRIYYYLSGLIIYCFLLLGNYYNVINIKEILMFKMVLLIIGFTLILENINNEIKEKTISNITIIAWVNRVLILALFICLLGWCFSKENDTLFGVNSMVMLFFTGVFQIITSLKYYFNDRNTFLNRMIRIYHNVIIGYILFIIVSFSIYYGIDSYVDFFDSRKNISDFLARLNLLYIPLIVALYFTAYLELSSKDNEKLNIE